MSSTIVLSVLRKYNIAHSTPSCGSVDAPPQFKLFEIKLNLFIKFSYFCIKFTKFNEIEFNLFKKITLPSKYPPWMSLD